ncbi:hypothetical protein TSOC_005670 [Tetrabaena socialis]|uniref:Proteasome assembly chaperone 1 n=1 Tax=Tetrabaena socialis TaxID=47790 RepID=A0A2J8A5N8_9CHLO|nr:hypothetical protein TSOC_005670 [Tetrabaena socialis]|eukprot:PNH07828.1 hypothetical protein TSOC_005670 [Tetrabaena socialis]
MFIAFTPSRAFLQEEEDAAAPSASGNLRPAVCVWNKRLIHQLFGQRPACDVLVVATCPTSCALLQSLPGKTLLGAVLAPAVSLAGNSLAAAAGDPAPGDRVCCVYALGQPSKQQQQQQGEQQAEGAAAAAAGGGGVLLVCCQYPVVRERAAAWARSVLGQVSYGHAVFLGAMPAEQFRGQGDASQEEMVFSLLTRAARQQQPSTHPAPAPLLPTGTVVGGLPAALLSHCQYPVVRERAAAWARSVLGQVSYGHAVFLGAMPAEQFRGQGDASQEEMVFSLLTRAARQQQPSTHPAPAPLLPTGTVVGGLPAALLSHCQVRGQSAELLVLVEMVAEGRPALLEALAAALAAALTGRGAAAAAGALAGGAGLAAARRALGLSGGQGGTDVYA